VWITIVGELRSHRNKRIFKGGRVDHIEIFTMEQMKTWSWITSKARSVSFSYSDWYLEPLICMRSVNIPRRLLCLLVSFSVFVKSLEIRSSYKSFV